MCRAVICSPDVALLPQILTPHQQASQRGLDSFMMFSRAVDNKELDAAGFGFTGLWVYQNLECMPTKSRRIDAPICTCFPADKMEIKFTVMQLQEGCIEGEDPEESFMLPEWNSDGEEQARKKRRVR